MSDISIITSEIFVAYSQCPRKAFLLLFSENKGKLHNYPLILQERRQSNHERYLKKFLKSHTGAKKYGENTFKKCEFLVEAILRSEHLEAYCTVLNIADTGLEQARTIYEPTIVTGTYSITPEQKAELLFAGAVLGQIQKHPPAIGKIVSMNEKAHRINLERGYKDIKTPLKILHEWYNTPPSQPPALVLNKHCQLCQFQSICCQQAEKENNLSLLKRMTPKSIQKYNKKGIFTIQQLSYLFKPRRKQKKKNSEPVKHNLELQALAIREKKIYIQEMPELTRQPTELFIDIEGIPDQRFYYLVGLLICEGENCTQLSLWANVPEDEETIWNRLLSKLGEYPEAPIYHYGSYEIKAFNELSKRYSNNIEELKKRFVNVNSLIFGKVYFPVFSNTLKDIGIYINAAWSFKGVSGLQSLVWRYKWEISQNKSYLDSLITYNEEDCQALKLLTDKISEIKDFDELRDNIQFADQSKKLATETGNLIHHQLELILKSSHLNYQKSKVTLHIQKETDLEKKPKKRGPQYGHIGYHRVAPKADKVVSVPTRLECPSCEFPLHEVERECVII